MTIGTDLEHYMLDLINEARTRLGLTPVALEQNLNTSALAHSNWMLANDILSHEGENDSTGIDRITSAGFDLGTSWGWAENIGAQRLDTLAGFYSEIDLIFGRWMTSADHVANILNPFYDVVGLGLSIGQLPADQDGGGIGVIATQNFATSNGFYDLDSRGTAGADTMFGAGGDDHLRGAAGDDLMLGGGGADTIFADEGNDRVNAGDGNDAVLGAAGNDFLRGAGGADTLFGDAGHDFLIGDAGRDNLTGGTGQDSLSGGLDDDSLDGGIGFDVLQGGSGHDTLVGGAQADNLYASLGDDWLRGDAGFDRLFGDFGNDTLEGGAGPDALFGMAGNDVMYGQDGNDRNYGAGGNDFIQDGLGDDLLEAGAGFDTLDGGAGNDVLFGRFNWDRFVFNDIDGGFGNDTIGDFSATNIYERVDLSGVAAITSLSDLMDNHIAQIGNDVLITAGVNSTILLENVQLGQLDETDFTF